MNTSSRCGYIAILGRPNVGKSTLLNRLIGRKVSITSKKPQTTRHQILGIKTLNEAQAIFVDTPGMHLHPKHVMNRLMVRAASSVINDVDIIIFVIDVKRWSEEDDYVLKKIKDSHCPIILALNKIDFIKAKENLLPLIEKIQTKLHGAKLENVEILPLSAKHGIDVNVLEKKIAQLLPSNPHLFPDDQITDRSERFMAAELIREKLMRLLGEELPHTTAVEIEEFAMREKKILHISAIIWVERKGQKAIVIGKKGEKLKKVGQLARLDMEQMFQNKVFLRLWVKVKAGWTDDKRALRSLGIARQ